MLGDALAGVVAQQLVRKADGSGRAAAHEILMGVSGLASLIREGKTSQIPTLIQSGQGEGMQSMDSTLDKLVREGVITAHDALEKATDKEAFAKLVAGRGP
jgi:twitching motility protein PilT